MTERASHRLPWPVRTDHADTYEWRMLRLYVRQSGGLEISDEQTQSLREFTDRLDREGLVVDYDSTGFTYVPARPGIDVNYVRTPRS